MPTDRRCAVTKAGTDDVQRVLAKMTYKVDIYPDICFHPTKMFWCEWTCVVQIFPGLQVSVTTSESRLHNRFCVLHSRWHPTTRDAVGLRNLSDDTVRYIAIVQPTEWHTSGVHQLWWGWTGRYFKNTYDLLNLRALKFSHFSMYGQGICVEFQRVPLKFHTKYFTHTLKDIFFAKHINFKSSSI